jgi:hypothetical protein
MRTMTDRTTSSRPLTSRRGIMAAVVAVLVALCALPAVANATLTEIGLNARTKAPTSPSCPGNPCLAVSRTTGFQVSVGSLTAPLTIPKAGRIVAWTIALSRPTSSQIKFFNEHEGGTAAAGIAILRPKRSSHAKAHIAADAPAKGGSSSPAGSGKKKPSQGASQSGYTVVAQSPVVPLETYFGGIAEFPLEKTLEVQTGDVVALTVPTWAPALTLGFGKTTGWRASRPNTKNGCEETSVQTAQTKIGSSNPFACVYHEARLTYSATLISTP